MEQDTRTVALIFGGQSPEHDVSIDSATRVASAMDELPGTRAVPVYVSRQGKWHWARTGKGQGSGELAAAVKDPESFARHYQPGGLDFPQALLHLTVDEVASAFIIIHGAEGEDGRLQAAFDLAGIPFTGSGHAACALTLDKPRFQAYLSARGLPVAEFMTIERRCGGAEPGEGVIASRLGFPCVVKPALCGSSVGVSIVPDAAALGKALDAAFAFGPIVHVEKFIRGREFTCGVLDRGEGAVALPVTEIIPPDGRFFDYGAKYTAGVSNEVTPADIPAELTRRIQSLAVQVHEAAGCEGFSRTDFMADEAGPKILEINTIPGMTGTSLLPQAAAAAGMDFAALVDCILRHSARRAGGKKGETACSH